MLSRVPVSVPSGFLWILNTKRSGMAPVFSVPCQKPSMLWWGTAAAPSPLFAARAVYPEALGSPIRKTAINRPICPFTPLASLGRVLDTTNRLSLSTLNGGQALRDRLSLCDSSCPQCDGRGALVRLPLGVRKHASALQKGCGDGPTGA